MSFSDIRETAKDILFPAVCPICTDAIPVASRMAVRRLRNRLYSEKCVRSSSGSSTDFKKLMRAMYPAYVCRECLTELEYIKEPYCKKCGKQLAAENGTELSVYDRATANVSKAEYKANMQDREQGLCNDCIKKERSFIQARCVITYDETAQEIMAGLKYKSKREYADFLSLLAADRLSGWIKTISPDIIIPVPIHKKRLLTRGYNQAELIAKGISELTEIPINTEILYRTKNTRAQKALTAEERLYNLLSAFEADMSVLKLKEPSAHKGKHRQKKATGHAYDITALLVDDIYTTGATMEACTLALKYAGVKAVYGLCICAGRDAPRIQRIKK